MATNLDKIMEEIDALNDKEIDIILDYVRNLRINKLTVNILVEAIEEKFSNGIVCPDCGRTHIMKNGKNRAGIQMYKCHNCGARFNMYKNTFLEGSKLPLVRWLKYLICMDQDKTLRNCADYAGVCLKTSFMMRHRVLSAMENAMENVQLSGIAEVDNTFVNISFSGNHKIQNRESKLPRTSYKRARSSLKKKNRQKADFTDSIEIATAIDRNGNIFARVAKACTKSLTNEETRDIYAPHMMDVKTVCCDGEYQIINLAKEIDAECKSFKNGSTEKRGIYHINHVNYFHAAFKDYLYTHNGVSSKYLNEYLAWIAYTIQHKARNIETFFSHIFSLHCTFRYKDCIHRPNVIPCE